MTRLDSVLGALGLIEADLLIAVYRDETTISVKLTHLPTGYVTIGTDSSLGATRMHPSSIRAARLAGRRLLDQLQLDQCSDR